MAHNTSLYLDPTSQTILKDRDLDPGPGRRSGRRSQIVRALLRRYDEICREDLPDLSKSDWQLLLELGQSWLLMPEAPTSELLDHVEKASADHPATRALLARLRTMSAGQRAACVDYVLRAWASRARGAPLPLPSSEAHKP